MPRRRATLRHRHEKAPQTERRIVGSNSLVPPVAVRPGRLPTQETTSLPFSPLTGEGGFGGMWASQSKTGA